MKCWIIIAFMFSQSSMPSLAQSPPTPMRNAILFEVGKTGLIYHLSFDHRFKETPFGVRAGFGYAPGKYLAAIMAGGGGYYLAGKTSHFLELGVDLYYLKVEEVSDDQKGFALVYPDYSTSTIHSSINIGYRKYGKTTLFRFGVSPGFTSAGFIPGAYAGFGFTF